jgi:hypothetical protein
MINDSGVPVLLILYIQFYNMALAMQERDAFIAFTLNRWDKS